MHRLFSFAFPLVILSADAIPIIPALRSPDPVTSGIVATDDGTVYFVDSYQNIVWRASPGAAPTPFVTGRNGRTLQLDDDGQLYGAQVEGGRLRVWRADRFGQIVELSRTDMPATYAHAFAIDDDGEVIAPTGATRRSGVRLWRTREHERQFVAGGEWGFRDGTGPAVRFFPIGGMTRAPDGDLLVTSGGTIRRIGADGRVRTVAANERLLNPRHTFLSRLLGDVQAHLTGIAAGARGEVYVANSARGSVVRVLPNGATDEILVSESGWTPTGVAVSGDVLFVLEYGPGVRVRRVAPDGTVTTLAMIRHSRDLAAAPVFGLGGRLQS